jgi:hypothetical protein
MDVELDEHPGESIGRQPFPSGEAWPWTFLHGIERVDERLRRPFRSLRFFGEYLLNVDQKLDREVSGVILLGTQFQRGGGCEAELVLSISGDTISRMILFLHKGISMVFH